MRARIVVAALAVAILVGVIAFARFSSRGPSSVAVTTTPATSPSAAPSSAASESPGAVSTESSIAPSAQISANASPSPSTSASPSPTPTPTAVPNLLSFRNGTFTRRWTVGGGGGGNQLAMEATYRIDPKFAKPMMFDFEMPSVAHLDRFGVKVKTPVALTVRVATATSPNAFRDAGTIAIAKGDDGNTERALDTSTDARWVRFTFSRSPGGEVFIESAAAYGTAGPPEQGSLAGTWSMVDSVVADNDIPFPGIDLKGTFPDTPPAKYTNMPHLTLVYGNDFRDLWCDLFSPAWHGTVENNVITGPNNARLQLADNGKMLIGFGPDIRTLGGIILIRDPRPTSDCSDRYLGSGRPVLAMVRQGSLVDEPEVEPSYFPGYRYHRAIPSTLNRRMLNSAQFAEIIGDCDLTHDLDAGQQKTLLDWVAAGHKLILRDSDMCMSSDYSFIPFNFKTIAVGARGARGKVLSIVDPSTLGAGKNDPAHFLDTIAYVHGGTDQDLGDSDVMQTDDLHWCGHLFSRNLAGAAGWVHTYARWGRGLIIYDGLDRDDLRMEPAALNVVRYEYQQPAQGHLPCNVRVASVLTLYPSADRKMAAGVPATLHVPMSLTFTSKVQSAGSSNPAKPIQSAQRVSLSISGDAHYAMHVLPVSAAIQSGQTIDVDATISLPKGWSGVHAFTVSANGQYNAKSQTFITLDGSVALARAFQTQRRVRIYGIHFDVDSATILPQSEATISQIAQVLRLNPSWHMRVEGYTDSDGGAAYNQGLSDRRAHSVVADLVSHYHIAASRLTAQGFGLTNPVAPNTTEGGKALNRRVELVRL